MSRLLSIGEFSKVTALTVKSLRHYHERGLLVPTHVDPGSGYRYYDSAAIDRAGVIKALRLLELPLDDIAEVLAECDDDDDAVAFLERQRHKIAERLEHLQRVHESLDQIIGTQKEARKIMENTDIVEKQLPPQLVAGIRMRGAFNECGRVYKRLGRAFGFGMAGPPGMLIYDEEFREGDADFEPYFPLKEAKRDKEVESDISVREIPGGRCLCLMHRGPYDKVSPIYARLFQEARERGLTVQLPTREVYIKGPGMIFRGNPEKYVTEVQVLVE